MNKILDIYRSTRSKANMEGDFPPSLVDQRPVPTIAEFVNNPEVLLMKQRQRVYIDDDSPEYPDDGWNNDVQSLDIPPIKSARKGKKSADVEDGGDKPKTTEHDPEESDSDETHLEDEKSQS